MPANLEQPGFFTHSLFGLTHSGRMEKHGTLFVILYTFSASLLAMASMAQASGPFRGPCETLEAARNGELAYFRTCLSTPPTSKESETHSTTCKKEDDGFRKAQSEYDSCRKQYALPVESEAQVQN